MGLRHLVLPQPRVRPYIRFLFVRSPLRDTDFLQTISHDNALVIPYRFALWYIFIYTVTVKPQRTFTSLEHAHAGRTQDAAADRAECPAAERCVKIQDYLYHISYEM